ncbi:MULTISPECIES: histone-like nucleoid-structuring protein Lsr2 [Nocardia]|uniref:histone-like nucleoid-structuring protein Lsr2 n=1 Tax=Nocardia TaxID=1817 RepID=UPI001894DAAB|nr:MULTISPECIES: Lsr2 family protein [Nocardia]MBF6348156.1 Lsr2 family protein [Nocardia flavorosea]
MARKVIVEMVDDYDGTSPAEETVTLALDGVTYEIDLSARNAGKLRDIVGGWAAHARRTGGRATKSKRPAQAATDTRQTQAIREWARANGMEVSNRGRIAAEVIEAYKKAHK